MKEQPWTCLIHGRTLLRNYDSRKPPLGPGAKIIEI